MDIDAKEPVRSGWAARHLSRHHRFYCSALAAGLAYLLLPEKPLVIRILAAGDAFFIAYLALLGFFAGRATPESTMLYCRVEDEGLTLIACLTMAAVGCSLTAIVTLLGSGETIAGFDLVVAILSVPLGWLTLHGSVALHYARLYYAEEEDGDSRGGLEFPGDAAPDVWDFLYFSFVLGMTAQTSDIGISGRGLRRATLAHSVVSFFYNTVIVALAVNVAVQIAG